MKLRFGIDATAYGRLRDALDATAGEPPVGRRLSYVYLDTPEDDLAGHRVALRFRRSAAAGADAPARGWRRQVLFAQGGPQSLKALGLPRLKQRVDATFTVRIERWTWQPKPWAKVSLDRIAVSTGRSGEDTVELRILCRRKRRDAAMKLAVELGAVHLVSQRARERGQALLLAERAVLSPG